MIDRLKDLKIALAHDWLVGLRGGERVLDRLARMFGPTGLYTLVNDGRPMTPAIDACTVTTSPLQRFPGAAGRLRRWYLPLMPWAIGRLKVDPCDLLISTSSAVMKSIMPPPGAPHLCYCHSPARYIWDQADDYAAGSGGGLRSIGLRAVRDRFQRWDRRTAERVTQFLANSRHTADRIRRCYGREAHVVAPPVRTGFFTPADSVRREEWLLVVAAHEPYKRTDLVIQAANRAKLPLKVAGTGSQWQALCAMAGPTVQMLGRVDDSRLLDLYRRARALVQVQVEDFGITAVEALATGCPVVAYARGGVLDIVGERTGVLFDEQRDSAIIDACRQLESTSTDPAECRASAERFSEAAFDEAIEREVAAVMKGA